MSIGIKERRFVITRDGAPYPPTLRGDDNFETADRRRFFLMAATGWKRSFDGPIPLPDGGRLITLQDAGTYITKLPKAEHTAPELR